jgi:hypothetical protein
MTLRPADRSADGSHVAEVAEAAAKRAPDGHFDVRLVCVIGQKLPFKTAFFIESARRHTKRDKQPGD